MSYSFTLTAMIPAPPQAVYDAWLDSRAHSAMTGGKASQSNRVGDAVMAWYDYIVGRNLDLVPSHRIVQTWRTTQFGAGDPDSVITVTLAPVRGGTRLTLAHANVPDGQTSYEEAGWREHYFEPMQRYFNTAAKVAAVMAGRRPAAAKKRPKKKAAAKKKTAVKRRKTAVKKSAKKMALKKKPAVKRRRKGTRR